MMNTDQLVMTIRKMLWEDWDPIGVNQFPEAADEYDSYATEVAALVRRGITEQELFDWLWALETGHIGLEGDRENTQQFATKLHELAVKINSER